MDIIKHFNDGFPFKPELIPKEKGLYAIYLQNVKVIDQNTLSGLIYIGKSESNIYKRLVKTHFKPKPNKQSINSTFRRSLGALLKDLLELKVIPRNNRKKNKTKDDFRKYQFDQESETKLTEWILDNCFINYIKIEDKEIRKDKEKELIQIYQPLLNIIYNSEHQLSKIIKTKRKQCRGIAERY